MSSHSRYQAFLAAFVLFGAAGAQPDERRIEGTSAFYWNFRDPYTLQNMSTVILDSQQTTEASLMLKCTGDGDLYFYVTTPLRLIPNGSPIALNKQVGNLYRVSVLLGTETLTPKLSLVGYLPVHTKALAFDGASSIRIFNALIDAQTVKVRIEGRPGAVQRNLNVTYTFLPEGFSDAGDAVDNCDAG